jgi:hypothetical protein
VAVRPPTVFRQLVAVRHHAVVALGAGNARTKSFDFCAARFPSLVYGETVGREICFVLAQTGAYFARTARIRAKRLSVRRASTSSMSGKSCRRDCGREKCRGENAVGENRSIHLRISFRASSTTTREMARMPFRRAARRLFRPLVPRANGLYDSQGLCPTIR